MHAFHGLYTEERVLGNNFLVDVTVTYQPKLYPITSIQDTIDYVALYELVKKRMTIATPLLETVVSDIAIEILAQFSLTETVEICIQKLHPPIPACEGSTGVSLILHRKDMK